MKWVSKILNSHSIRALLVLISFFFLYGMSLKPDTGGLSNSNTIYVESFRVWREWSPIFPPGTAIADGSAIELKIVNKRRSRHFEIDFYDHSSNLLNIKSKKVITRQKNNAVLITYSGFFKQNFDKGEKIKVIIKPIQKDTESIEIIESLASVEFPKSK